MIPKIIGYLLVLGLLLTAASPPASVSLASSSTPSSPNEVPRQPSLLGTSGGEENIDSFTVHPANRWESTSAGGPSVSIDSGQLQIETHFDDVESAYYYRDSQTVDSDIATRWWLNSSADSSTTNVGDFQIDLLGINSTNTENLTLSAFQWNSSHYVIRPVMTVGEKARSWHYDTDYQDWAQINGTWGADGWDFLQEDDDSFDERWDYGDETYTNGILKYAITDNTKKEAGINFPAWCLKDLPVADWYHWEIKMKANEAMKVNLQVSNSTDWVKYENQTLTTTFTTYEWDTSSHNEEDYYNYAHLHFYETDDSVWEGTEVFYIDSIRLLYDNDSSDLTFYEYETYYRGQLSFNLRQSKWEYEIQDDTEDDLQAEEIGDLTIDEYFTSLELIPDVFEGEVGSLDFLIGLCGAYNVVDYRLDFYQAEFAEFTFKEVSRTETDDSWESTSPYACSSINNGDGGGDDYVSITYNLTVPEFDSCTGRFSLHENGSTSAAGMAILLSGVTASTGVVTSLLEVDLMGYTGAAPDGAHQMAIAQGGTNQVTYTLDNNRQSESTFSFHLDKANRKLSVQSQFTNSSSVANTIAFTEDLAASMSNEIVITVIYLIVWSNANTNSANLALTDWSLTFRDLFGLPIDLPKVGDSGGLFDAAFDILLLPLRAILNAVALLPGLLGNIWDTLTSVEGILGVIDTVLDTIYSAVDGLEGLLSSVITEITDLQNIMNIIDSVLDTIDSVLDSILSELESLAGAIWDQFSSMLDDYWAILETIVNDIVLEIISYAWDITEAVIDGVVTWIRAIELNGVVMGDLLDLVDTWADLFFLTANDTIDLAMLLLTTWAAVVMVGLFCLCLLNAAAVSEGNGAIFLERFTSYMMANVNPITFIIDIKLPLGLFVIPYVLFVVLTGFDWVTFFTP